MELAEQYLAKNIPLDGLGLQSHMKEFVLPHPAAIWVSVPLNYLPWPSVLPHSAAIWVSVPLNYLPWPSVLLHPAASSVSAPLNQ